MLKKVITAMLFMLLIGGLMIVFSMIAIPMLSTKIECQEFLLKYLQVKSPIMPLEVLSKSLRSIVLWVSSAMLGGLFSYFGHKKVGIK